MLLEQVDILARVTGLCMGSGEGDVIAERRSRSQCARHLGSRGSIHSRLCSLTDQTLACLLGAALRVSTYTMAPQKRSAQEADSLLGGVKALIVDIEGTTTPISFVKVKSFLLYQFD